MIIDVTGSLGAKSVKLWKIRIYILSVHTKP